MCITHSSPCTAESRWRRLITRFKKEHKKQNREKGQRGQTPLATITAVQSLSALPPGVCPLCPFSVSCILLVAHHPQRPGFLAQQSPDGVLDTAIQRTHLDHGVQDFV